MTEHSRIGVVPKYGGMFCYSVPELKAHVQLRKAYKLFLVGGIPKAKKLSRHSLDYLGMEILQWLTLQSLGFQCSNIEVSWDSSKDQLSFLLVVSEDNGNA